MARIEPKHIGIDLAKVNPDFLGVLALVNLFVLFLIKSDLGPIEIHGDNAGGIVLLCAVKCNLFLTTKGVVALVRNISAPVHALALLVLRVWILVLLILIRVEQRASHHVLVGGLVIDRFIFLFLFILLRHKDVQCTHVLLLSLFLTLLVDHALLFHSLTVLDKLVVQFILDETVKHASTNNVVTFGHFITHASCGHELDHNWLRCLNPICLELLVTDSIKEHLALDIVILVRDALSLNHLQVSFVVSNLCSDGAIQTSIELCKRQLTLT